MFQVCITTKLFKNVDILYSLEDCQGLTKLGLHYGYNKITNGWSYAYQISRILL